MGKLTVLKIQHLTEPGQYGDGDRLYLQVKRDDQNRLSRSWVYRFKLHGKRREMGLGPVHLVSLAEARQKVLECTGQNRFYKEFVPIADDLYDTHLRELKAEGLI